MGADLVHAVLAMEARAERWYVELRVMRRRLEDPALPEEERAKLEQDVSRKAQALDELDEEIARRRKAMGDVFG